ncbi:hypothetical protein SAMN05192589_101223 [Paracidovorax valerianellae]|uniref:Uncharacterized protein n=1 Tax=Paracidovorax valerianellae TaxID=187868 RepID=A0A1G6IPY8_9BURK|nr:hypothetical protein [Paracidovorax valerianellae]SDC08558.1 hypothetical protein SAMN05192589_101223 [Paracidovorax valerianellae]
MPNLSTITAGARVTYQGDEYKVRSVDGNVLELAYDTGGFFRLVHMSSVTACPTPAIQTAASLPAPAAGQGKGTSLAQFERAFDAMCDLRAGSSAGQDDFDLCLCCDRMISRGRKFCGACEA